MRTGRPKQRLELSDKDRADLEAVIRSRSLPLADFAKTCCAPRCPSTTLLSARRCSQKSNEP